MSSYPPQTLWGPGTVSHLAVFLSPHLRTNIHSLGIFVSPPANCSSLASGSCVPSPSPTQILNFLSLLTPATQKCVSHTSCPLRCADGRHPPLHLCRSCHEGFCHLPSHSSCVPVLLSSLHSQLSQHLSFSGHHHPSPGPSKDLATCSPSPSRLQSVWSLHYGNLVSVTPHTMGTS